MNTNSYDIANQQEQNFMKQYSSLLFFARHTAKGIISYGKNICVLPDIEDAKFWIELKCKNRRLFYNDTGFSERLFDEYCAVQKITKKPIIIAFKNAGKERLLWQAKELGYSEDHPAVQQALYGEYGVCAKFVDGNGVPDWYGGFLSDLELSRKKNGVTKQTANNNGELNIYFPLSVMRPISEVLKELQKRMDEY